MYYVMLAVPAAMLMMLIVGYWKALYRMGFMGEVITASPNRLPLDAVTALLLLFVFNYVLHAWSGHSLFMDIHTTRAETSFVALGTLLAAIGVARVNAWERFAKPTMIGMKEAAICSLVSLRIVKRAEDIARADREQGKQE